MHRKDNWSFNDDQLLSNIVLNTIKIGETQLVAFDKASDALNRTSAACGFRWNSNVRKKYTKEIIEVKMIRNENRKSLIKIRQSDSIIDEATIDEILLSLLNIKLEYDGMKQKIAEKDRIIQEYESKSKIVALDTLQEDMKNFLRILNKSSIIDNLAESEISSIKQKEPAI